tara:strand:- start:500 stop:673 length:174 start_codon:yes stop_codon:yes gene_type:complete
MDYEKYKRELKLDLEGLKEDLLFITNNELIKAYQNEILNKNIELEDIILRIAYLSYN